MSSRSRFQTLFSCITLSSQLTIGNVRLKNIGDIAVRLTVAAAVSCILLSSLPAAEHAAAAMTQATDIPPEGLGIALEALARDRKLQLIYATDDVGNRYTEGAAGNLSTGDALNRILKGTGLSYQFLDDKTVTVQPVFASSRKSETDGDVGKEAIGSTSRWENLRLAQANSGMGQGSTGLDAQNTPARSGESSPVLSEVIVTAQKKSERLQDVPVPISVVDTQVLAQNNQNRLQDYFASVPGLNLLPSFEDSQFLSIRGITTGSFTNPTVGFTVDDVPYGGFTTSLGGANVPDLDPSDLDHIEVLRGPQGTLYGASSMGGLIKYVTVDPSVDALKGQVQAGTSSVHNGAELGYNFRGSVNVPITETWAVRASAFTRLDPGYIDNPVLGVDGVNEARSSGGRVATLWRPSEIFSVKLSALYQQTRGDGTSEIDVLPGLGDLQQNLIRGVGGYENTYQSDSATLNLKLGKADLTSITGYNIDRHSDTLDYTNTYGKAVKALYGVAGAYLYTLGDTKKFTQELRLSVPFADRFDWLLGGFFDHDSAPDQYQYIEAENTTTGQGVGQYYTTVFPRTFREYAAFTDLTYHVTSQLNIQFGGRYSATKEHDDPNVKGGPYTLAVLHVPAPDVIPAVEARSDAFTYLVTPQFKLSTDFMVYARLASGYRPGGPNVNALAVPTLPSKYESDKTENYEVGLKGDFLEHRLSVDASLYYIDWKNIQIGLLDPTTHLSYQANGGGAKSEGVEISVAAKPWTGMTISAWVDYDDAVLTEAFPKTATVYGAPGDRLPDSSKFSGNISPQQEFPFWGDMTGFLGATVSYVGDRVSLFQSTAVRQVFPAYAQTDLRAGTRFGSWTANFFVNNVADRRGVLDGGRGYLIPYAYYYIRPRTIGLNISKAF
jgi:iron complex outermembrane receptor protein